MRGAKAKRLRRERPDRPNPGRVCGGTGPKPPHITTNKKTPGQILAERFLQKLGGPRGK